MNKKIWMPVLFAGLMSAGCGAAEEPAVKEDAAKEKTVVEKTDEGTAPLAEDDFVVPFDGKADHVHGMGYIEGNGLYFATHHGLKIHRDGGWFETDGMRHDYMGFNAVDDGFYTSGHPAAGSDMENLIGIQRSMDGGRSLEPLGFSGETDFHAMAAGYRSHHLFVMNPAKNSQMGPGFNRSENEGKDWTQVEAKGLNGEVSALAMHPEDSQKIAAATSTGVYLSKDGGATFNALTDTKEFGTAVFFAEDALYFASYGTESMLTQYTLETKEQEQLALPDMPEDGVLYIARNPDEFAIYTVKGQAFVSKDGAADWTQIMEGGQVK